MIHFTGDRSFSVPLAEVAAKLSDAGFLVHCVAPDEDIISATPTEAVWKLRPGFSFVRGTLEASLKVVAVVDNVSARFEMHSKGIGASSTVLAELTFLAVPEGTTVHWTADITETTGLLKMVPKGLLQSAAGKVIEDTWANIDQKFR